MRAGYSATLRERTERVDPTAGPMVEIVAIAAESLKKTAYNGITHLPSDWDDADSLTGLTVYSDGGVQLNETASTAFDQSTIVGGQYITALGKASPFTVAEIDWGGSVSTQVELLSLTVRLAPNVSGGTQEVQQWVLQLFNQMDEVPEGKLTDPVVKLVPISTPFYKTAGTSEGDVVFSWAGAASKPRPKSLYPSVLNLHASPNPITYVMIWALKADGTTAGNVGWAVDSANSSATGGGNTLKTATLTQTGASFIAKPGSAWYRHAFLSNKLPRIKAVWNTATAATITFTTNPCDLAYPNKILHSEEFDHADWSKYRSSVTPNVLTAPDSTLTMDKLVEDGTAAATHGEVSTAVPIASGEQIALSIYAKAGERTKIRIEGVFTDSFGVNFDLSTGAVISTVLVGAGTIDDYGIEPIGNGIYRLGIVGRINGGRTSAALNIELLDAAGSNSYNGDGTSGAYIWGAQLERFASSVHGYVRTPATPTDTVEFTGTGEVPLSASLTFAVQADDATWLPFVDGDTTDDLTTANPGHPITKRAAYAVRATLTPTSAGDGTPTLRTLGVRALVIFDCTQIASVAGGSMRIDPVTLKPSIADATLTAIHDGEPDFRDLISTILSTYQLGQLSVRTFRGAADLDRGFWMPHQSYLIDDYRDTAGGVELSLLSVLVLLRGVLPAFNPNTLKREAVGSLQNVTIEDAWVELIDGQIGLAGQYRGSGPTDTKTVSKVLPSNVQSPFARAGTLVAQLLDQQGWQTVQAKDQVDAVSFLAGGATVDIQGRIQWVPICVGDIITRPDASLGFAITQIDPPRAFFHEGEVQWLQVGPGFAERVPEYYVPYNWNVAVQKFGFEHRGYSGPGLLNLGIGRNASQPTVLDTDVAQWIVSDGGTALLPTSSLARRIAARQTTLIGTGLMLWRFRTTYAHPELTLGDTIVVPTDRFVACNPITGGQIVGRYTANAMIVETSTDDRTFGVWIRQWSDLAPALATAIIAGDSTSLVLGYGVFVPVAAGGYGTVWNNTLQNYAQAGAADGNAEVGVVHLDQTQLPQGAHLVEVAASYYLGNAGGGGGGMSARLWEGHTDGSAATVVAFFPFIDTTATNAWQTPSVAVDYRIDWTANHYFLEVGFSATGVVANARFMWYRLKWQ